MKQLIACSLALLVCGGALTGCGHKGAADTGDAGDAGDKGGDKPAPTVQVATVRVGPIAQTLPATGTLQALRTQEATISPPVAGVLDALPIRFGQYVRQGQVIAHLSTRQLQGQIEQAQATIGQNRVQVQQAQVNALQQRAQTRTAIQQAEATLANAQATFAGAKATLTGNTAALRNAQQNLTREQTLFQDGLVAQKDVEAAQLAVQTAQAQLDAQRQAVDAQRQTVAGQRHAVAAARAASLQDVVKQKDVQVALQQTRNAEGALRTARAQAALYTLRTPLSGQVTMVGASLGETVDTTAKIATVANLDTLQLQVNVPAASAREVHPGQALRFRVESLPGKVFTTTVRTVGTQVDTTNNTVPALCLIPNPGHRLKDDTFVQVQIVTRQHPAALLVPKAAVLVDPSDPAGKASVVTVGADGTAHSKDVKAGLAEGGQVEILSGVKPGQTVVTTGAYGLPDGTKVTVAKGAAS